MARGSKRSFKFDSKCELYRSKCNRGFLVYFAVKNRDARNLNMLVDFLPCYMISCVQLL